MAKACQKNQVGNGEQQKGSEGDAVICATAKTEVGEYGQVCQDFRHNMDIWQCITLSLVLLLPLLEQALCYPSEAESSPVESASTVFLVLQTSFRSNQKTSIFASFNWLVLAKTFNI